MTLKNLYQQIKDRPILLFVHLYQLILALVILIGFFYIRLLPGISRDLWQHMNDYQVWSTIFKLWLVLFNIYIILKLMSIIDNNTTNKGFFSKVKQKMDELFDYIINILINFYNVIWYLVQAFVAVVFKYKYLHYQTIRLLAKFLLRRTYVKKLLRLLLAIAIVPRVIFTLVFMYDVLIEQRLHYIFSAIPILLIPFVETFIIFVFQDFYTDYWQKVNTIVKETEYTSPSGEVFSAFEFNPNIDLKNSEFPQSKNFTDFFENHYSVFAETDAAITVYKNWKYKESPYLKILLLLAILRFALLTIILFVGISYKIAF